MQLFNHTSKQQVIKFALFLLLYEVSVYIANDMIMPGMIAVIHSFGASDHMVPASLTAFILGGSSLQLVLGPLSDRFGRRPIMLIGAWLFLICTILISISQNITEFILARFFQGMGLCFIGVVGYAVLQEILDERSAVRLIALMSMVTIMAPLIGPLLGAIVIHAFNWRAIFIIIAISSSLALCGLWRYMPETVGKAKTEELIVPVVPLSFATIQANYLSLMRNRRFIFGAFAAGLASIPIIAWIGTSPLILLKAAHLTVIQYGLWQLPVFIAVAVGNLTMRFTTKYLPLQRIISVGSFAMIIGLIVTNLILWLTHYYTVTTLVILISIYAYAFGFIAAPLNRLTLFSTMISKGTASAMVSITNMLLTAAGNQIMGELYIHLNNEYFAWFCLACGGIYLITYQIMLRGA